MGLSDERIFIIRRFKDETIIG